MCWWYTQYIQLPFSPQICKTNTWTSSRLCQTEFKFAHGMENGEFFVRRSFCLSSKIINDNHFIIQIKTQTPSYLLHWMELDEAETVGQEDFDRVSTEPKPNWNYGLIVRGIHLVECSTLLYGMTIFVHLFIASAEKCVRARRLVELVSHWAGVATFSTCFGCIFRAIVADGNGMARLSILFYLRWQE